MDGHKAGCISLREVYVVKDNIETKKPCQEFYSVFGYKTLKGHMLRLEYLMTTPYYICLTIHGDRDQAGPRIVKIGV